jgi:hypothetical protein
MTKFKYQCSNCKKTLTTFEGDTAITGYKGDFRHYGPMETSLHSGFDDIGMYNPCGGKFELLKKK